MVLRIPPSNLDVLKMAEGAKDIYPLKVVEMAQVVSNFSAGRHCILRAHWQSLSWPTSCIHDQ